MGLLSDQQTDPPLTSWFPKHTSFPPLFPLFCNLCFAAFLRWAFGARFFSCLDYSTHVFVFPFLKYFSHLFYFASRKTSAQLFQRFSEPKTESERLSLRKKDWTRNHRKLKNQGKEGLFAEFWILISCYFPRLDSQIFTIPKSRASHLLNVFSKYKNQVFFSCIRKLKSGKSRFFSQLGTYVRIVRTFIQIHVLFAYTVYQYRYISHFYAACTWT